MKFTPSSRLLSAAVAAAGVVALAGVARADRRAFTETYEYTTMPEGQTAVELHTRQSRATFDGDASPQAFVFQLEIEHGITERWDVALYHVFAQASDGMGGGTGVALTEMKLETRYRFAERGERPVDFVIYGELAKQFGVGAYDVEGKAILARDFGRATVAANLIAEVEFGPDVAEAELELGWAAGLTYEVSPRWKVGAESWGGFEAEHTDEVAASVGPALSWAPASRVWISATAGFGVTDEADAFSLAAIVGLEL